VGLHQGAETVHAYLLLGLLERDAREGFGLLLREVPAPLLKNLAIFVAQAKTLADFEGPGVLREWRRQIKRLHFNEHVSCLAYLENDYFFHGALVSLLQRVVSRVGAKTIRHFSVPSTLQGKTVFSPAVSWTLSKGNGME
jgi:hypothetical protein